MANIGTFTAEKDGFTGTLRTLTLNVKVKLVPNDKGENESAPDFRLQAAGHDFGAAWKKTSEAGRDYLSVAIDDPSFPATVYARLIEGENGTHDLIWSRSKAQGGLTTAHRVPPFAAGRGAADLSTARTGFRRLLYAPHVRRLASHRRWSDGSKPVAAGTIWRVGALRRRAFGLRPANGVMSIRLQSLTPSRLAALRAPLAGIQTR